MLKALIKSMRLRTLPLSLAGVVCGGLLAMGGHGDRWLVFALVALTACLLQVLSNLSNEMGDYKSGVDNADRQGPVYGIANGLTERQLWNAINGTVVACCVSGLIMVLVSGCPWWILLLGAVAIWAATHYTLGKNPYGYRGLGDLFVFIFFGLVSVLGSHYVVNQEPIYNWYHILMPAAGVGFLSVAVLNVNNIRDMESDRGLRKTVALRLGERRAKWYQTIIVVLGMGCFYCWSPFAVLLWGLPIPLFVWHLYGVWTRRGHELDPMLPVLVIATFLVSLLYGICVSI